MYVWLHANSLQSKHIQYILSLIVFDSSLLYNDFSTTHSSSFVAYCLVSRCCFFWIHCQLYPILFLSSVFNHPPPFSLSLSLCSFLIPLGNLHLDSFSGTKHFFWLVSDHRFLMKKNPEKSKMKIMNTPFRDPHMFSSCPLLSFPFSIVLFHYGFNVYSLLTFVFPIDRNNNNNNCLLSVFIFRQRKNVSALHGTRFHCVLVNL